ncbi:BTAD domain-containing putative transcriptional regulator [Micromonospora palomenae]|uniref:BTAD domain-containing putative transcriptional regulator n=1 Tax=Micromonospora palomenae TaxID=1461247 RepID=UPI003F8BA265
MRSKTGILAATTATAIVSAGYAALLRAEVWRLLRMPSASQLRDWVAQPLTEGFIVLLAQVGAGLLAVYLLTAVISGLAARLARAAGWLPALHLPGPLQGLAAALLGATAITAAASATPAAAATDAAVDGDGQPRGHGIPETAHEPKQQSAPPADTSTAGNLTYTVRRGDTLSSIAARRLGDDRRWPDIYDLNRGTHFPRVGGTLRDPNVIYPGWTLDLPADAIRPATRPQRPVPSPPPGPSETRTPHPGADAAPPASPAPTDPASDSEATTAPVSPATPTTSRTAGGDPAASPAEEHRPDTQGTPRGITLLSGSWIDLGVALALAAAVALVWAHRRHHYTPRPLDAPWLDDAGLRPMPRVVGQIRRGLRRALPERPGDHQVGPLTDTPQADGPDPTRGNERDADGGASARSGGPMPVAPAVANPLPALWPPTGLGLTGAGAEAAARGFLIAALASGAPHQPHARTMVVAPAPTAAKLLGVAAVDLPRTPRLLTTSTLAEALDLVETQTLHRARLVDHHDVDTVTDLRDAAPDQPPPPPLMLLAEAPSGHQRARVAALLTQGQRLDVHGVLLGSWPDGTTIAVGEDGATTCADTASTRHSGHFADVGWLTVLYPAESLDLLTTLAESHTGQPPTPSVDQLTPADLSSTTTTATVVEAKQDIGGVRDTGINAPDDAAGDRLRATSGVPSQTGIPTSSADASRCAAAVDPPVSLAADADGDEAARVTTGGASASDGERAAGRDGRVQVTVLGAPGIVNADSQRNLRAKSQELLVYLAVRGGGATAEAILDDLLPDAPARKATHRLHTYVSDLRSVLRHNGGPGTYLTHPHHTYQLNPERLDIDLWRMRAAIRHATSTTSRTDRITALRRAVDAYRKPLADGCGYEWLEPYREAVRQEAHDAAVALAEELADQPTEQLAVLHAAIAQHPYAEGLYQAAMRAHAQLGQLDAIRALHRTLTRALSDIDTQPSAETANLADHLTNQTKGRTSPPGDREAQP